MTYFKSIDETQLRALWASDLPTSQIAAKMGVSKSTVANRVKRLGLKPRPPGVSKPPMIKDCQAFRDAWNSQLSYRQIGNAFDCSLETVKRLGKRFGYPERVLATEPDPPRTPAVREGIRRAVVTPAQSGLNESSACHVSLPAEPWAASDAYRGSAPVADRGVHV
jgi:DNA-binding CsgD family transcriptional regulator